MGSPSIAKIRIGTRGSRLALVQAEEVASLLRKALGEDRVTIVPVTTAADRRVDLPLHRLGGTGLFVKELEVALREGEADLAVHSAKDLPSSLAPDLRIAAFTRRADPRDALVARVASLESLPPGARVGTSSLRRVALLRRLRPDLAIEAVRGNVETRLAKLDAGAYDALILAAAGLDRLHLSHRIASRLDPLAFLPAVGQGALAIEVRADDERVAALAARLNDVETAVAVAAERAFLAAIEGGCQVPAGAWARYEAGSLRIDAFIADPRGERFVRESLSVPPADAERGGRLLAQRLLERGGTAILADLEEGRR